MHLLYYGGEQEKLLQNKSVEAVLRDLSVKQGRVYDSPESVKSIPSFIKTYSIQTEELRQPDISTYKTFNEFFYRCAAFHIHPRPFRLSSLHHSRSPSMKPR
jgi:phosphatidylserine decarboxylase